jgi:hypothetical protein
MVRDVATVFLGGVCGAGLGVLLGWGAGVRPGAGSIEEAHGGFLGALFGAAVGFVLGLVLGAAVLFVKEKNEIARSEREKRESTDASGHS